MKKRLAFSFLVLGVTSLIAQVLLLRELMIVFYGNEFFIGWTLLSWLFWVGMGSVIMGSGLRMGIVPGRMLVLCHASICLLLPLTLFFIRSSRLVVGAVPGQVPDLLPALGYTFAAMAPLCFLLGAQFVVGAKAWTSANGDPELSAVLGRMYGFETVGFLIGGTLFGYWLVTANEFRTVALLVWLNVAAGAALYGHLLHRFFIARLALIAAAAVGTVSLFIARPLNLLTSSYRFPGQRLVETRNSIYGNIAVTRIDDQFAFYENGLLLGAAEEAMANEYLVHLPLLYHRDPKRVLLLGGGLNGALREILKHNPESVDYVELDPLLIATTRKYIPERLQEALDDPRVRIVTDDGRIFLRRLLLQKDPGTYDAVIVNLPNPGTILINRYYSEEFFRGAAAILRPGGIFSTHLAFSPDYVSPELTDLGASVHRSLSPAFASVVVLPEYSALFIASRDEALGLDPRPIIDRLHERGIRTDFLSAPYIEYRLTTDRIDSVLAAFRENRTARVNRDQRPIACAYNLLCWISALQPGAARALRWMTYTNWKALGILLLALAGILAVVRRQGAPGIARLTLWAMAAGSFSLMACEVVIILAFQILYGYVYHKISLLIAGLMLGMAAGTWAATRLLPLAHRSTLVKVHAAILVYVLLLAPLFRLLGTASTRVFPAMELIFLGLAAVIGAVVGFEFPLVNRLYLAAHGNDHRRSGIPYGADLLGSCLGAFLVSLWLLPVMGVSQTLLFIGAVNAILIMMLAGQPRTG